MSMSIHFPSDADNQGNPSSEVGTTSQHRATPDVAATNENAFSPVVQATSTPVNAVDASNDTRLGLLILFLLRILAFSCFHRIAIV